MLTKRTPHYCSNSRFEPAVGAIGMTPQCRTFDRLRIIYRASSHHGLALVTTSADSAIQLDVIPATATTSLWLVTRCTTRAMREAASVTASPSRRLFEYHLSEEMSSDHQIAGQSKLDCQLFYAKMTGIAITQRHVI